MNIGLDKQVHLKLGLLFAICGAADHALVIHAGPGYALMLSAVVMGWAIERYQAIRREGTPDKKDWIASSMPGVSLGAAIELYRFLNP